MSQHNTILVIHADDSDQHSGHLKRILDAFKNENRIKNYTTLDSKATTKNSFDSLVEDDMVILLLTEGLEDVKATLEGHLLKVKQRLPELKIVEIIIDHVPYEQEFIAFPSDLQPIRSREDMDTTWIQIGNSLKNMYPVIPQAVSAPGSKKWKKFTVFFLGFLVLIAIFFAIRELMSDKDNFEEPVVEEFQITGVDATVQEPANYRGECPHEFQFVARITSNGPGKVSFIWEKSDGTASAEEVLEFAEAGTKNVASTWELSTNASSNNIFWQQLVIRAPGEKRSNKVEVTVECIAPIAENCFEFDNRTHAVEEFTITGRGKVYSVSYDAQSLIGFRDATEVKLAKDIVEFYGFNTLCYTKRINSGLRYFKTNNTFPSGAVPGEDCMRIIDPSNVTLARNPTNNTYSVRDGGSGKFLFIDITKNEADKLVEVIGHYKPKFKCKVGIQKEGMLYMRY